MIVRISTEGQYELSDADAESLNELDNQIVLACDSGDATAFHATFSQMLELVRTRGTSLGEDDLSARTSSCRRPTSRSTRRARSSAARA